MDIKNLLQLSFRILKLERRRSKYLMQYRKDDCVYIVIIQNKLYIILHLSIFLDHRIFDYKAWIKYLL